MMWPELSALSLLLLAYLSSQFVGGTKTRHRLSAGGSHLRFHKRACGLTVWREMSNGQDAQAAYLGLWSMHKLKPDSVSEVSDMRSNLSGISFDYGEIKNGSMPFSSNLSALMVPFRTELHFASIQGMISLAQEPGTIRMGTELHEKQEINVSPGQVEFLIKICHLPWHHLHRDLGDYIDLKFKVKDRSLHQVIYPGELEARTPRFQMGWTSDTGYIDLASRVYRKAHWTPMLSGYPRPERGPQGEHLLALRAYLPEDCMYVLLVMEPGHLYPEEEPIDDVMYAAGSSLSSSSSSLSSSSLTFVVFHLICSVICMLFKAFWI